MASTHARGYEGGRKLHIADENGDCLCWVPDRYGHLASSTGEIADLTAWLALDVDAEVCGHCRKAALKLFG